MSDAARQSSTTGRIDVGAYTLEVGEQAGSTLEQAETRGDSRALRRVLRRSLTRRRERKPQAGDTTQGPIENAAEVMEKVEHGAHLFVDLAGGRLDSKSASEEVDFLIGLLQRLDENERWEDELRVARCLAGLLALLARWGELVDSLRGALHAAEELGDPFGEAWALHELGTLHLIAGSHAHADVHLEKARTIRKECRDSRGVAATNNNLQVLCKTLRDLLGPSRIRHALDSLARRPVLAVTLAATLFVIGGAVGDVLARPGPKPYPATVSFSFEPSTPHTEQSISFTATANDPRDPVASYTWQWGDGDPTNAKVKSHTYTRVGVYRVVLTVRDAHGHVTGEAAQLVNVQKPPIEHGPNAYFSFAPRSPTVGSSVLFDAHSSYDTDARIALYQWSFGDDHGAHGVTVSHSFAVPRTYRVTLTVTDTNGRRTTLHKTVAIARHTPEPPPPPPRKQTKTETILLCRSTRLAPGETTTLSGSVKPAREGVTVKITYTSPTGIVTTRAANTDANGAYQTSEVLEQPGTWIVQSSQTQGTEYAASASTRCEVKVEERAPPKTTTKTAIRCPGSPTKLGATVVVFGSIRPVREGATVVVSYLSSSSKGSVETSSNGDGYYSASVPLEEPGLWSIQSSQTESSEYTASVSTQCKVEVEEAG